jgi:hypothetical protein
LVDWWLCSVFAIRWLANALGFVLCQIKKRIGGAKRRLSFFWCRKQ